MRTLYLQAGWHVQCSIDISANTGLLGHGSKPVVILARSLCCSIISLAHRFDFSTAGTSDSRRPVSPSLSLFTWPIYMVAELFFPPTSASLHKSNLSIVLGAASYEPREKPPTIIRSQIPSLTLTELITRSSAVVQALFS